LLKKYVLCGLILAVALYLIEKLEVVELEVVAT
jgi:hypothetical protein